MRALFFVLTAVTLLAPAFANAYEHLGLCKTTQQMIKEIKDDKGGNAKVYELEIVRRASSPRLENPIHSVEGVVRTQKASMATANGRAAFYSRNKMMARARIIDGEGRCEVKFAFVRDKMDCYHNPKDPNACNYDQMSVTFMANELNEDGAHEAKFSRKYKEIVYDEVPFGELPIVIPQAPAEEHDMICYPNTAFVNKLCSDEMSRIMAERYGYNRERRQEKMVGHERMGNQ